MTAEVETRTRSGTRLERWLVRGSRLAGIIAAVVGAAHLAGWFGDYFVRAAAEAIIMVPNTAFCIVMAGLALALMKHPQSGTIHNWVMRGMGLLVLIIGLVSLLENMLGWNVGIDQLLAKGPPQSFGMTAPNRMGTPASMGLILLGSILLLMIGGTRRRVRLAQALAAGLCLIALLGIMGFSYGAQELYAVVRWTAIAWPTALSLLVLGAGLLCARPTEGLMAPVTAPDSGGIIIRRLLPLVLLPIVLGWVRVAGERWGWFDAASGTALMMILFMLAIAILTYTTGVQSNRSSGALRESEARLKHAQQIANLGSWEWDIQTGALVWSDQIYRQMGEQPGQFTPNHKVFRERVHPEDRAAYDTAIEEALAGRAAYDLELRIVQPDKAIRVLHTQGEVLRDVNGQPCRMVGVSLNITEPKKAEEALRQSELFYRQTLESIPGMVFTTRPDGYCDYQSQQWVDYTGVPMSQHLGDGWNQLLHPEDRPRAFAAWQAAVEGRAPYDLEYRVRRYDGAYEWFKVIGRPILDGASQIVRWFGVALKIEEFKQAEEALRRGEEQFRTLADSIPNLAWWANGDGYITWYNRRWYEYTGTTPEQMEGWGWQSVHDPEVLPQVLERWKASIATGEPFEMEFPLRGADGRFRLFLTRGHPLKDPKGKVMRWFGTNTDVDELKRTADALQQSQEHLKLSLREKEVMLKEIHHRVKNNLQVIASLVDLQTNALADPALQGIFQDVRDRVRSMALVHEKLYQSESLAQVDFADYARSLLNYIARSHGSSENAIALKLDLQPVLLSIDTAVPCGLILNELVSNAFKHAFRGRAKGEITAALGTSPDAQVFLRVSDNGVGLPAGMDWQQSRSLGLRLIRLLAGQLGASVSVHGNGGAKFEITFQSKPEERK